MLPLEEARSIVLSQGATLGCEEVLLQDGLNRVMPKEVISSRNVPLHRNSAMDGYAFVHTENDSEWEVIGEIPAGGELPEEPLKPGECYRIMTGAPLPKEADTVCPQELVEVSGNKILLHQEVKKGSHIRPAGEDIKEGEALDLTGRPLGPGDLGVLASLGITQLEVFRRARVAIFGTGNELVEPGEPICLGQVVNSNNWSLAAAVSLVGAEPLSLGQAEDSEESIRNKFGEAHAADVIVSTGGVSVGDYDYVQDVLANLGVDIKFWKVAIKPGKPLLFGVWEGKPVFGLPGNPVSALVNFELFIAPLLRRLMGYRNTLPFSFPVTLMEDFPRAKGRTHCLRCYLKMGESGWEAYLNGPQGSGILRSMSGANAMVFVEETLPKGSLASAHWLTGSQLWL